MSTTGGAPADIIHCASCGAEIEQKEPCGFWETGENTADARRQIMAAG